MKQKKWPLVTIYRSGVGRVRGRSQRRCRWASARLVVLGARVAHLAGRRKKMPRAREDVKKLPLDDAATSPCRGRVLFARKRTHDTSRKPECKILTFGNFVKKLPPRRRRRRRRRRRHREGNFLRRHICADFYFCSNSVTFSVSKVSRWILLEKREETLDRGGGVKTADR